MEDVLDVYMQAIDPRHPRVCFDERPTQLIGDTIAPIPMTMGQAKRVDYQYERFGSVNLFMMCAPFLGWREVKATSRRTKVDFAHCMKELVDLHFPDAQQIIVVLDNLNTHTLGALYEAFSPTEARRIARKLDFHYTPKHASWLNIAEIEISVLSRQCLKQRIPSLEQLAAIVQAWTLRRNAQQATINWCFDLTKARTKLAHLYP
jgi:DDE superfamily endonuclease